MKWKTGKATLGFRILYKIWQIWKHFAGTVHWAQTLKLGGVYCNIIAVIAILLQSLQYYSSHCHSIGILLQLLTILFLLLAILLQLLAILLQLLAIL